MTRDGMSGRVVTYASAYLSADAKALVAAYRKVWPVVDNYLVWMARNEVYFLLWRLALPKRFKRRMGADIIRLMWETGNKPWRQSAKSQHFGTDPRDTDKKFQFGGSK